ncbi:MAG: hypothetical protein LIO51_02275 [Clostridiales bacterium]|nr:hypothetical protein [Clostridiales bacterium]
MKVLPNWFLYNYTKKPAGVNMEKETLRKLFAVFEDQEFNQKLASLVMPIALQQFMLAVVSASDAIMLKGASWGFLGNTFDIEVTGCT